jgi:hypothetical protein
LTTGDCSYRITPPDEEFGTTHERQVAIMEIRRIHNQTVKLGRGTSVNHAIYEGAISDKDAELAHTDPEKFLKKAKISFPSGAQIHVSADRMVGPPANGSAKKARARIGVGVICRVVVIVFDGYVFVYLHCIPVIIITRK